MQVTAEDVRAAAARIRGEVIRTPLAPAPGLGRMLGCELYLKLENFQRTGSFKERGALVRLKALSAAEAKAGVIAMSAGNHAQGVAYHARRLGIPATIVMPEFAPFTKVERTREFGARVVLAGDTLDAAAIAAREIAGEKNLTLAHPYDDPLIVAGQGSIGFEMLEDAPDLDTIVVPIGGGGIISGIAIAAKSVNPEIHIVGVQAEHFPSMYRAIRGLPASFGGPTLADGIAVKKPGEMTREIVAALVEDIVLVDEATIETAVSVLAEKQRIIAEGAGAAGIAALMKEKARFAGRKVGVVITGGNVDVRLLSWILARGLARDGRMVRLRIEIHDHPGMLARVAKLIGDAGGNIIEVLHQRFFYDLPAKQADIDAIVETRNAAHVSDIVGALRQGGFRTRILSARSDDGQAPAALAAEPEP